MLCRTSDHLSRIVLLYYLVPFSSEVLQKKAVANKKVEFEEILEPDVNSLPYCFVRILPYSSLYVRALAVLLVVEC